MISLEIQEIKAREISTSCISISITGCKGLYDLLPNYSLILSLWEWEVSNLKEVRCSEWVRGGGGSGADGVKRGWMCRLPECGARRGRWKRVEGPATAPPGTAGMRPTHLGCWDIEQALWAHLWKEEEEEWSEEGALWTGERPWRRGGRWRLCGGAPRVRIGLTRSSDAVPQRPCLNMHDGNRWINLKS